jgi:hypothetical protein
MPDWNQCLRTIVLLSIAGFTLVILSGLWKIIALLIIGCAALWLWRTRPTARR